MRVIINNIPMNLQENDEVEFRERPCKKCGSHIEVTVTRDKQMIAHFGEYVRLVEGVEEQFSDVVAPKDYI